MLGLTDIWVAGGYAFCVISTLICLVYGVLRWNAPDLPNDLPDEQ